MVKQLRFDPVISGSAGESAEIEYISAHPFPGDFGRDEKVDFADFATLAAHWGEDLAPGFVGDLSGDRKVGWEDVAVFAANWLRAVENYTATHWKFDETNGLVAADAAGVHAVQLVNFPSDDSQ